MLSKSWMRGYTVAWSARHAATIAVVIRALCLNLEQCRQWTTGDQGLSYSSSSQFSLNITSILAFLSKCHPACFIDFTDICWEGDKKTLRKNALVLHAMSGFACSSVATLLQSGCFASSAEVYPLKKNNKKAKNMTFYFISMCVGWRVLFFIFYGFMEQFRNPEGIQNIVWSPPKIQLLAWMIYDSFFTSLRRCCIMR